MKNRAQRTSLSCGVDVKVANLQTCDKQAWRIGDLGKGTWKVLLSYQQLGSSTTIPPSLHVSMWRICRPLPEAHYG
jgi:hypothetical protein